MSAPRPRAVLKTQLKASVLLEAGANDRAAALLDTARGIIARERRIVRRLAADIERDIERIKKMGGKS